jgi:ribosomal protein S18 acetylase RimI-like enzyme
MDTIHIVPTAERYIEDLQRTVDAIARERRYLGFVEGPPLEHTRAFVRALIAGAGAQFLAIDESDSVNGWCDIFRNPQEGFRHRGQLGMGVLPQARGRGLGARLAAAAIEQVWSEGLERVELEVFASNVPAIGLYRKLRFNIEGVKRRARKLDGSYDDIVFMALIRDVASDDSDR